MVADAKTFADTYAHMRDEDIERLSLDVQSLLPDAREILRREMERRQMSAASIDWQVQPAQENNQELQPQPRPRPLIRKLVLGGFFLLEAIFLVVMAYLIPAKDETGAGKIIYYDFKAGLLLSLVLGGVIAGLSLSNRLYNRLLLVVWIPIALLMLCALCF